MPDYGTIIFTTLFVASSLGCADSIILYKKSQVIKELDKFKTKTRIEKQIINEYRHFFDFKWYHYVSWASFCASGLRLIIDSY